MTRFNIQLLKSFATRGGHLYKLNRIPIKNLPPFLVTHLLGEVIYILLHLQEWQKVNG